MKLNQNLKNIGLQTLRTFKDSLYYDQTTIDCSIGDPPYDPDWMIKQEAVQSILGSDSHYCEAQGYYELRKKIHDQNPLYSPDEILITSGSSEALAAAFFSLLEKGDTVILIKPYFPLYKTLLQLLGINIIELETKNTAWQIEPESLMSYVGNKIKAIIINNPNNPSGAVYNKRSREAIQTFIETENCWCIVDEVYKDYSFVPFSSFYESESVKKRIITVRSFSKSYFMCGYRLGYLMCEKEVLQEILKVHQSWMTSLPLFIQKAGRRALDISLSAQREKFKRRRAILYEGLIKSGAEVILSDGGFYLFFKVKGETEDSQEFCRRCAKEAKVILTPGIFFNQEGYIRITALSEDAVLKEAVKRIREFLKKSGNPHQSEN